MELPARSERESTASPSRRVILLGASNVTRSMSTIVETAELVWGRPLDLLAACGHGRSYGRTSCVFGRSLPGILECGLWDELSRRPALPTAALVTDIGNDILYGAGVDQIAAWVEQSLIRLRGLRADRHHRVAVGARRVRHASAVQLVSRAAVPGIARDVGPTRCIESAS